MYTRISRTGGRAYLQLVQAFRDGEGRPRQRTVANLGRLDQLTEADLEPLIGGLKRALGQPHGMGAEPVFESARAFGDLFAYARIKQIGSRQYLQLVERPMHPSQRRTISCCAPRTR